MRQCMLCSSKPEKHQHFCANCRQIKKQERIDKARVRACLDYAKNRAYHRKYYENIRIKTFVKLSEEQKKAKHKEHRRKHLSANPGLRIFQIQKQRIWRLRKDHGKGFKIREVIGCTHPQLKAYIEKQFLPGMSWENYSLETWHVDHIISVRKFNCDIDEELLECFHYSNLRPLWAQDNLKRTKIKL